ncbi:major facilitator superfamily domain-containing protein [Hyaloraphidium curvatum]|nr:major facilitator superfamily domain-containing protein [Hyaloraphidium curvatum]
MASASAPVATRSATSETLLSDVTAVEDAEGGPGEGEKGEKDALAETAAAAVEPEAVTQADPPDPPHWRTNIALLVLAWTLGYTAQFMHFAGTVALAREMGGEGVATIPNGLIFVGALISTMPISILGERAGLKVSYLVGTCFGLTGAGLCLVAVYLYSYPVLCVALLFQGTQAATTSLLRFGVGAVSPKRFMSKAVSFVVAGAAIASPIGPQLAIHTKNLIPAYPFMGMYIVIFGIILLMSATCACLRFPPAGQKPKAGSEAAGPQQGRLAIVGDFLRSKKFLIATIAGMTAYAVMVLMMAPAPLAILGAGYSFADQANVMMAHVLGMFVPSLFTGFLIDRLGSITMNIIGMITLTAAVGVLFAGNLMPVWYVGECLIGIGWNFSFISASSIILKGAKPGRQLQTIQGVNDTFIQLLMAVIFIVAAPLYKAVSWTTIAAISCCMIGLAAVSILAIARLPMRGLRDDLFGVKGYVRQPKDEEIGVGKDEVEMGTKEAAEGSK